MINQHLKNTANLSALLILTIGIILIISTKYSNAAQIDIYRWVDKKNVVHFSQELPQPGTYLELDTISSYESLSKEYIQEKAYQEEREQRLKDENTNQSSIAQRNRVTFEKNCIAAKQNIKMLTSFDEVLITETNSDGKNIERILNDKEKQEKLKLSERHVELYCQ